MEDVLALLENVVLEPFAAVLRLTVETASRAVLQLVQVLITAYLAFARVDIILTVGNHLVSGRAHT